MTLVQFTREHWLARKLDLGEHWDAGTTTAEQRAQRIRRVILERGLADLVIANTPQRGPITWAQAFRECTGQPLITDELNFGSEPDSAA